MRSCIGDGGFRPSEVCLQGPISNHPERHWLKTVVVSVREKAWRTRQVWIEKANTREPSFKCRNYLADIRTGEVMLPRDKLIGNLLTGWAVSGIEMARTRSGLLCGTAGTWCCDAKGADREKKIEVQSTEAQARDGSPRSSVEESVMDLERRGRVVLLEHVST